MHGPPRDPPVMGKECLLDLDAQSGPLATPPWLYWEATGPFEDLASGAVDVEHGMVAVRDSVRQRAEAGLQGAPHRGTCALPPRSPRASRPSDPA